MNRAERKVAFNPTEILAEGPLDKVRSLGRVARWGRIWQEYNVDRKPFLTKEDVDRIMAEKEEEVKLSTPQDE